jgi:hypothetical protein
MEISHRWAADDYQGAIAECSAMIDSDGIRGETSALVLGLKEAMSSD